MMRPTFHRHAVRGAAATEFLIMFPALIFLLFGVIQWGLIYQARATLDHAVLLAARAGAVQNGNKNEMKKGLAAGLAPLFASEPTMTGYTAARGKAFVEVLMPNIVDLKVVNPTDKAVADFGQARLDGAGPAGDREIPNDTLIYRNTSAGATSGVSVQDANILHVRVGYCYRLIVPVVGRMIHAAKNALTSFDHVLQSHGMSDPFGIGSGPVVDTDCVNPLAAGPRIRIQSEAIVRMQSPYYRSNL